MAFTKLKQIPSRICDFRLLLLTSRKPSSEHPKSQILVVGSIVFEHLFDLSGSTLGLDLLRAWLHACSAPGPKLPQADPKSDFPKTKFQPRLFCKTVRTLCKSQPQKERGQKDAAAVFRVACSIRRSNPTPRMLLGVLDLRWNLKVGNQRPLGSYTGPANAADPRLRPPGLFPLDRR